MERAVRVFDLIVQAAGMAAVVTMASICGCSPSLASRSASVCVPMCCSVVRRSLSKSAVDFRAIPRTFLKPR